MSWDITPIHNWIFPTQNTLNGWTLIVLVLATVGFAYLTTKLHKFLCWMYIVSKPFDDLLIKQSERTHDNKSSENRKI